MQLIWGHSAGYTGGFTAKPVEGVMLALCQTWGVFVLTVAAVKLTTVFTHQEGTFLRKNLLIVLGLANLLMAYFFYVNRAITAAFGADNMPYVAMMSLEGGLFLYDALMRERKMKKVK